MKLRILSVALLLAGSAAAQPPPPDANPNDPEVLRHELDELRVRQRELERRLDAVAIQPIQPAPRTRAGAAPPVAAPPIAAPPVVAPAPGPRFHLGRDGFAFGTADGQNELRVRAVMQFDARVYVGGDKPIPDTLLIRRARPYIEGTLFGIVDFRLMPDFAPGQALLQDAYAELHPWRWLRLRAGKFKSPFGLEFLQNDTTLPFLERSLATDLVPFRDTGVMLSGDIGGGTFSYAAAVLDGAADGANGSDVITQDAKDYLGRIFVRPLRAVRNASWVNLGFGVAGSYGKFRGTAAPAMLPSYRSTAQLPMFSYLAASAISPDGATLPMGEHWRVSPQLYLYMGPFGLLSEYVMSSHRVRRLDNSATIDNKAWNVTASFMLTLEHASYEGVVPRRPIDFKHRNFGAFELALRYSELRLDAQAFPEFADPAVSAREAREFAAGLNWHLTELTKIMVSYHRTDFVGGGPDGGDRESENAILMRLQLAL